MNQRCDGAVRSVGVEDDERHDEAGGQGVQRCAHASARGSPRPTRRWRTALAKGVADKKSKGFVIRPDGLARFRYKWNDTTVQLYLIPKSKEKISVVVQHTKLPSGDSVERVSRRQWKTALGLLADHFNA